MLSILIPTYNCNVTALVTELHDQCSSIPEDFEIIIQDDASTNLEESHLNKDLQNLSSVVYFENNSNLGRSANRNLLASRAKFDLLLFIDAGTFPKSESYVKTYLTNFDAELRVGGMTCLENPPPKPYKLRWLYTKKREGFSEENIKNQSVICSSNFLITKPVFQKNKFDESLKKYGCEDVVFFDSIITRGHSIDYLDNPVIHDAKDDANTFIRKTEEAIENLITLIDEEKIIAKRYGVSKLYNQCKKLRLQNAIVLLFKLCRKGLIKNFNSSNPSIRLYDFYRLGYYALQKETNDA